MSVPPILRGEHTFLLICNEAKFISKGPIPQPSLHLKETKKKIMNMDVNTPRVAKGKGIEVKYHKEMLPHLCNL